jgi:antirestriction protein ArdC
MDRKQLYADVTAEVVRQIEAGAGTWRMPWHAIAEAGQPVNASTSNAYRGGNQVVLGMVAVSRGWSGTWATYKQWQAMGAQVRKGEKSTYGVKWSSVDDRTTGERKLVPFTFCVFAAEQVDGYDAPAKVERDTPERVAAAEVFFDALGADVRHGGNRAAYSPAPDFIVLPNLDQFDDAPSYYSTRAHESAHWTGHASRLDRNLSTKFGSDAYAAEELVAELSAAFTCARLGLSMAPRPDHAPYLASWLRVLRADTSAIFTAASKAQGATDFLLDLATTHEAALVEVAA